MNITDILFAKKLAGGGGGGGGGGSNLTLLAKQSFNVKTSSTSVVSVGTISCGEAAWNKNAVIWVHVRIQTPNAYAFYGTDAFFVNAKAANGQTTAYTIYSPYCYAQAAQGVYTYNETPRGVFADTINPNGDIPIKAQYNASATNTINGTFDVEVYAITLPNDEPLFD